MDMIYVIIVLLFLILIYLGTQENFLGDQTFGSIKKIDKRIYKKRKNKSRDTTPIANY